MVGIHMMVKSTMTIIRIMEDALLLHETYTTMKINSEELA